MAEALTMSYQLTNFFLNLEILQELSDFRKLEDFS